MNRSHMLFGISSAAAAVILAVGVLLFTGGQRQQVNAATILNSLRARAVSGVKMVITNVREDGTKLDGQFLLHFHTPRTMDQLLESTEAPDPTEDVDVLLDVTVQAEGGDMDGFSLDVSAAFSPTQRWIFAKSSDRPIPPNHPAAMNLMLAQSFLRQGAFLDLTQFDLDSMFNQLDALDPDVTEDDMPEDFRTEIEAQLGHSLDDAEVSGTNINGNVKVRVARPGTDPDSGQRTPGTLSLGASLAGNDGGPIVQLLTQMLTGRAGPAQFDQFRQVVENAGGTAAVESLGGGRFLLTATAGPEDGFGAVQITYSQDSDGQGGGVDRIEMLGIGSDGGGTAVLTFLNDPIDPASLNPDRVLTPSTFIITKEMLGMFLPMTTDRRPPSAPTTPPDSGTTSESDGGTESDSETNQFPDGDE